MSEITNTNDMDRFLKEHNTTIRTDGKLMKIVKKDVVPMDTTQQTAMAKESLSSSKPDLAWGGSYYQTYYNMGTSEGYTVNQTGSFGEVTLTLAVTHAIGVDYSVTGKFDSGFVSAELGFSVNETWQFSDTCSLFVPSGRYGLIYANRVNRNYCVENYYDPWFGSPYLAGYAYVHRPIGINFYHSLT